MSDARHSFGMDEGNTPSAFVAKLLSPASSIRTSITETKIMTTPYNGQYASQSTSQKGYYENAELNRPDLRKTRMFVNRAAALRPGHLLLVSQGNNTIYCMDPNTGDYEFVLQLYDTGGAFLFRAIVAPSGEIFCTVTGARYKIDDKGVNFGAGGGIFRIDHAKEKIELVPRSTELTDPCGLQMLKTGHLLVTDFDGFRGEMASVFDIQPATGKQTILAKSGKLNIPIGAYLDENKGELYVANAIMQYEYPDVPHNDTGNLLRYRLSEETPDKSEVIVPESYPPKGSLLGVNGDESVEELVIVTCGAPIFRVGALIAVDRVSGVQRTIIESTQEVRRFFSPHSDIRGGLMYAADSFQKKLLVLRMSTGAVERELSLAGILGSYRGIKEQFDVVDCVSVIPEIWEY